MAKRAKEISSLGGDLLLAKPASKDKLISSLTFTKLMLTTMTDSLEGLCAAVQKGHTQAKKERSKNANWNNTSEAMRLKEQAIQLSDVHGNIAEISGKLATLTEETLKQQAEKKTSEYNCYLDSSYSKFDGLGAFVQVLSADVPQADPVQELDCGADCDSDFNPPNFQLPGRWSRCLVDRDKCVCQ